MKVCLAIPVRDKAKFLHRAVQAALSQDFSPLEIILSDQGSKDGSLALLKELASKYDGPHKVRVLECPITNIRGMPALNEHLNWIHNQTDADTFVSCAADDWDLPTRVSRTVEAFQKHNPSMVLCAQYWADEDGKYGGETGWPLEDGWVKPDEVYTRYIGGSTIHAWTREFYEKIDGLQGVGSQDMVMPFLACLDKGCYYLNERLHVYLKTADPDNTGLEGVYRATESEDEKLKLEELMHFQVTAGIFTAATKMNNAGLANADGVNALVTQIVDRAASWQKVRQLMALKQLQPLVFKA